VRLGLAVNRGDASQDGAAIRVSDTHRARAELQAQGVSVGDLRVDVRNGEKRLAFSVVTPDGLCFYFHQPAAFDASFDRRGGS
jgi:hypothetical protein